MNLSPHTLAATAGHFHAVRFYQDAASLARIVSEFLAEGLIGGQPAVVIATAEHRDAIEQALHRRGLDVERLKLGGNLLVLDADEMLAEFFVDGMPDANRFRAAVVPVLAKASRGGKSVVRAYGEMVDLLWRAGHTMAATRLEMLWNDLAKTHDFSLLCGYSMGNFYKDVAVEDICKHHTHVFSDSGEAATAL
jgi:hypothetical protein